MTETQVQALVQLITPYIAGHIAEGGKVMFAVVNPGDSRQRWRDVILAASPEWALDDCLYDVVDVASGVHGITSNRGAGR
jgi:hypothetical protein